MNGFALEILRKNKDRMSCVALADRNGTRKITWESLADTVCRVAAYARREGLSGIVPVCMDRGMEVTASLLGLNLAGVGVAPLSAATPAARCEMISRRTGNPLWTAETFEKACGSAPAYEFCSEGPEADPAYVVFTSGSTGTPKGVLLSNRAVLGGISRAAGPDFFRFTENDRMLQYASLSFVVQVQELLAPLFAGTPVYILPEESRGDLHMMEDFVNRHGITCLAMPPQLYRNFHGGPSVRAVCIGGDRIAGLGPKGFCLTCVYGMSETAGYALHYEIRQPMASTPIGTPCGDIRAYVLDEEGNEAEEGELCMSGAVAHGYSGMEELSRKTFTPNPFSDDPGHRILLHSGDLVRRLPEGGLLFLSRRDNMIKINGQRVEPGEIETALLGFPGIDAAAVKKFTDEKQHSILCGYYTGSRDTDEEKLRSFLKGKLPHYMVPQILVRLESMPVNSNGKLDRGALSMPDLSLCQSPYEAPADSREARICRAFEKVLGLEKAGRSDDFFALGGDSITALEVAGECGIPGLSTGSIFAGRTPKAIAALTEQAAEGIYADLPADLRKVKLTDSQLGILLDCGLYERSSRYCIPVHLDTERTAGMTAASVKEAVDSVIRNHPALYAGITEEDGEFYMLRNAFPEEGICSVAVPADCGPASGTAESAETSGKAADPKGKRTETESQAERQTEMAVRTEMLTETADQAEMPMKTAERAEKLSEAELLERYAGETAAPIAPGTDPLCTVRAVLGRDRVHIFMNLHHAVSDGSSVAVLVRQLEEALSGKPVRPETVDAFSLSEAERRIKASPAREAARTYYEHLLAGTETDSSLIPDHKPSEDKAPAATETIFLPTAGIQAYLRNTGITESTFFMGVFGYTLAKMTGQSESVFGAAENGRGNALLADTVSMLVKTLPVVLKIDEEKNAAELLEGLQAQFFASMRNDCVGFQELAKEYGVRSDIMFVYQAELLNGTEAEGGAAAGNGEGGNSAGNTGRGNASGTAGMHLELLETGEAVSRLSLMVRRQAGAYELRFGYRADLYERRTILRLAGLLERAAKTFLSGSVLKETELIGEDDRAFLDGLNASGSYTPSDETIIDLFKASAKAHPDRAAIIAEGRSTSYAEADALSDRIAAYLSDRGIGKGSVVSVLIPRCEYMLTASMGILKAGAAYQPLDPSYPEERLRFMVNDAKAAFLIRDRRLDHLLRDFKGPVLYTDEIPDLSEKNIRLPKPSPEDLCVLLYTSGTTGTPKGVMLSHGNLRAFVYAQADVRKLTEHSVVTQYASYGFDAHMHEIYPAVLKGCSVTVVPEEIRLDLAGIKEFCETSGVTHLFMTTQVARQFAVSYPEVRGLEHLDTAGEKLVSFTPPSGYRFLNLYGPTEGTVCSTWFTLDRYYENIPIGKAIGGYRIYVADPYGRRVPVGVPGELIQCGPQVGLGYLDRPDLTEKVFVPNHFEEAGEAYRRCYRTGDIVRFLEDGNIEYIGRRDQQVKIRGFRIELGEVEKAIRDYPKVKDATVAVMEGETGKNLCAYVVSDEKIDAAELGRFISSSHPAYMVPAVTMQIDRIPLNANGKVDKRKLPKPVLQFEDVRKPENELQQQIYDCAAEATGTAGFGIDTDLFLAGLSSIGSIRLCTLLSTRFRIPVKLRDLRRCGTVAGLENFIRGAGGLTGETEGKIPVPGAAPEGTGAAAVPVSYGEAHPLTGSMEGIFTECLRRPGSTIYNIPYLLKLGEGIDEERLKKAVACAVEAHPCMKAELFTDAEGRACQHRRLNDPFTPADIRTLSLSGAAAPDSSLVTPFELTGSRLFEFSLIHADGLYLFLNIHHIIADGTSIRILMTDIERAYAGEALQQEAYSGFDAAEDEKLAGTETELEAEQKYYNRLLEGTDKDFLPLADQPEDASPAAGLLQLTQVEADAETITDFCRSRRLSLNAYFLSVFGTVLAAYAGTDYSVFNTVYNGRNDPRTGNTVAMLVKTLPVVCHTDRDSVTELIREISGQLLDSMSNDLYSYAKISRNFGLKNDVMFIFQGEGFTAERFCGVKAEETALQLSEAKASLSLQVLIRGGRLHYELEYDPKRFTEALARAFVLAFDTAAAAFSRQESLKDISLLSGQEEALMEKFNQTELDYDRSLTIPDLFLEQAKARPEALCVEYNGKELTYGQVDELTAKLSFFLMREGIGRGDIAAILIRRDENMVIGAHGVIRAGAAYLGLDPTYPPERLEFMIRDCGAKILIADRSLLDLVKDYQGKVICTDEIPGLKTPAEAALKSFTEQEKHRVQPEDSALIVYSSGTTGLPKGSVLSHGNIVCFYQNYTRDADIRPGSRVAMYASFGFDGGAQDVFCVPMAGAALYVIPDEIRLDLSRLEQFYVRHGITSGFMTTQVGCMFITATRCRTLRSFLVGGEKLIPVRGPEWVRFRNGYGPSETMCYVNLFTVKNAGKLQPIGRTSRNTKEYIIDRYGHRLPFGACGELCIAGGQVGKGYLGRPDKTAEVFVPNPFCADPEYAVMYRTGDIVRMLPDGNYDFAGRRDGQVKIRGFRVELSEVEQQIRKFPGVTAAAVRAYDNPSGGKFLAAYAVMDGAADPEEIRAFIGKEKPDYMIPAVILQIDEIPLTSNGKVDFNKLPKPEPGALRKGAEPANETEEKLCDIFREVTGAARVYADDDFFRIGGSSISAIQAVVKCEQAGYPVVYKNLFANPTPQKLAAFLAGGETRERSAADFGRNGEYDYSALAYNIIPNLPGIRNDGVGDVLLTGVTGFLGCHVFRELMESTSGRIICLIRNRDGLTAELRFATVMTWYFEDWYREEMKSRTVILDGELEDEGIRKKLEAYHFDTIINCAANVKHFAAGDELMSSNFSGVENLIGLAETTGARLIQISSLSVSGESVDGSVPENTVFRESDLNIGQSLENQYIYTKYLAEQAVIDAVSRKRIRGKVIRLGNLMARLDDSQFQVNASQNGMLRLYRGFAELGCFPVNMLDAEIEFSPIDTVARAVVLLSGTPDEFTVFHAKNCNAIHYGYLLQAMIEAGYPIEIVEDSVFEERLQKALENTDHAEELGGLLAYRNSAEDHLANGAQHSGDMNVNAVSRKRLKIAASVTYTTKALYRLGFGWPLISMDYLRKMVRVLAELDFFEV